jgi:hypothetical protein
VDEIHNIYTIVAIEKYLIYNVVGVGVEKTTAFCVLEYFPTV